MNAAAHRPRASRGRWGRYVERVRVTWDSLLLPAEPPPTPGVSPRLIWHRARDRVLPNVPFIVRLTAASVVAYLAVEQVYPGSGDLTGALTALLVVRASLVETFSSGLDRIVAVLTGVLIATVVASVTGLTWWSLAIVVGAALTMAWLFDLSDNRLETAISAMLILGAATPDASALERAGMTLIGAAIGFASTVFFPPPVMSARVSESVPAVCEQTSATVRVVAEDMRHGMTPARFDQWIRALHRVLPEIASVDGRIRESENRRRYNPRALGADEAIPVLRAGLASLDRVILGLRHALMSLQSRFPASASLDHRADPALEGVFSVVVAGIADAIGGYGNLIRAAATEDHTAVRRARRAMAEDVAEARAMLADLSLADPAGEYAWMLNPTVIGALEAVLNELSPERQHRRLSDWQARQAAATVFPLARSRAGAGGSRRRRTKGAHAATGAAQSDGDCAFPGDSASNANPPTLAITFSDGLSGPAPLPAKDAQQPGTSPDSPPTAQQGGSTNSGDQDNT